MAHGGLNAKKFEHMHKASATDLCVAITGANGSLGRALLQGWHHRGARLIALSSSASDLNVQDREGRPIPLKQVCWQVGAEAELRPLLAEVDVLVLNHGVNVHGKRNASAVECSLAVNALSSLRLLELFAGLAPERAPERPRAEVWVNTSEAEILPAFSPLYEISKRLMGQLLSLRALDLAGSSLRLRRLVLGPFRSNLNPIGLMSATFVANQVLTQARLGFNLIIITPNPLTYLLMPLASFSRMLYYRLCSRGES